MDNYYKSKRWKALREKVLRRDGYMCQISKRYGKLKEAETVHHIFPRDSFPELQWKSWNLISVTKEAHNALHVRQTSELSEEGKELVRRTCRKTGVPVPPEYIPPT